LVFLDESSINLGMTRLYGWGESSERVVDYVPDVRFSRLSIVSTIRLSGEQAPFVFSGTLNGKLFKQYISEILAPTLNKGDIVIMDNLSSHKVKGVIDPILDRGATVLYLPAYSPDMNPIELSWSKVKSILRALKARTYDELIESISVALNEISLSDITNWFMHDGYIDAVNV